MAFWPRASSCGFETREQGLTLTELLVAMAVMAVTLSIALPSFAGTVKTVRLTTASNELLTSLTLARSQAMTTRNDSVVCASASATDAAPRCGGRWNEGWIVFTDLNGDGEPNLPAEPIWEQHPPLAESVVIAARGAMATQVRFQPIGTARGYNGTFSICAGPADVPQHRRKLVVAFAGRVRVLPGDDGVVCS